MADLAAGAMLSKKQIVAGNIRMTLFQITKDGTGVTAPITPGAGYTYCVGSELGYTVSAGVFTLKQAAGTSGDIYDVLFLSG